MDSKTVIKLLCASQDLALLANECSSTREPTKAGPTLLRGALLSGTRPTTCLNERRAKAAPRDLRKTLVVAVETVQASNIPITATLDNQVTRGGLPYHLPMPPQWTDPELNPDLERAKTRRVARAKKLPGFWNQLQKLGKLSLWKSLVERKLMPVKIKSSSSRFKMEKSCTTLTQMAKRWMPFTLSKSIQTKRKGVSLRTMMMVQKFQRSLRKSESWLKTLKTLRYVNVFCPSQKLSSTTRSCHSRSF